jgi:hypothetical protein
MEALLVKILERIVGENEYSTAIGPKHCVRGSSAHSLSILPLASREYEEELLP